MTTTSRTDATEPATAPDGGSATIGTQQWVALASVLAGAIHLAVTPEHLEQWWVFGAFFVAVGCFQLGLAVVVLRRPSWLVALTGVIVNLGVVLTYVMSRTAGLPIEPPEDITSHEGSHAIEGVGPADLVATGAELLVVCLLVTLLPTTMRRVTVNLMLVIAVCLWAFRLSGVLG